MENRLTSEQKDLANKRFTELLNAIEPKIAAKKAGK
jgi:hypothetical protein